MKKIIISLKGYENSGKTFVLNQVISKLLQNSNVTKVLRLRDYKDKTYLFYINESIIMITTLGDYDKYVKDEIEFAFQEEPSIINVIVYAQRILQKRDIFPYIDYLTQQRGYSKGLSLHQVQARISKKKVKYNQNAKIIDTLMKSDIDINFNNAEKLYIEILKYI